MRRFAKIPNKAELQVIQYFIEKICMIDLCKNRKWHLNLLQESRTQLGILGNYNDLHRTPKIIRCVNDYQVNFRNFVYLP